MSMREDDRRATGSCCEDDDRALPETKQPPLGEILREWTATLDAIEDLISVHDGAFRIVRVNRALARRLGCEPAELIGQPCYRVFHGTDEPWPECPHREAWSTGARVVRELEDSRLGVPLEITCSPYRDHAARLLGTVHVARDVSDRRRREQERESLIAELQEALARAKLLSGLLPICACCKKIRDDRGTWNPIEGYIRDRSEADFTHGICPQCSQALYPWLAGK